LFKIIQSAEAVLVKNNERSHINTYTYIYTCIHTYIHTYMTSFIIRLNVLLLWLLLYLYLKSSKTTIQHPALDKICHSEELFLHNKIDSISMHSPQCASCESRKNKNSLSLSLPLYNTYIQYKCVYVCVYTFYTFTVSGTLLGGNGFRWKLTHKWIHCRRKLDSKINPCARPCPPPRLTFILFRPSTCNTSNTTRQSKHRSGCLLKAIGYLSRDVLTLLFRFLLIIFY